jgi:hypothetical protein
MDAGHAGATSRSVMTSATSAYRMGSDETSRTGIFPPRADPAVTGGDGEAAGPSAH